MNAPKEIYITVDRNGESDDCFVTPGKAEKAAGIYSEADSAVAPYTVEPYVHRSVLAEVQARLDKLVEAAEYMRDDICEGEHDEAMLKLRTALAAAKGETL